MLRSVLVGICSDIVITSMRAALVGIENSVTLGGDKLPLIS